MRRYPGGEATYFSGKRSAGGDSALTAQDGGRIRELRKMTDAGRHAILDDGKESSLYDPH